MRAVITAMLLCLYMPACHSGLPLTNCQDGSKTWNRSAYDHYKKGEFQEAISEFRNNEECSWVDQQMVFNSYAAIYIKSPSPAIKNDALREISKFENMPTWLADPGPLLVVLGEDHLASAWYVSSLNRLSAENKKEMELSSEAVMSRERYFKSAVALIDASSWSSFSLDQKLRALIEAEHDSRDPR